jgi:hypothetical protein
MRRTGSNVMMRWICVGLGVVGFAVAYRVSSGNLLASISLSLTPIVLFISIERVLDTTRQRSASTPTEPRFLVQQAGGAKSLRHQALLIRICSYMLIVVAIPMLVVGIIAAIRGSLAAFFIALAAAFILYGAKYFLSAASKMFAAASEAH